MKKEKQQRGTRIQTNGFECIGISRYGGCGAGWTCDRCPNVGCPANERN